jgi:hypothetical protein
MTSVPKRKPSAQLNDGIIPSVSVYLAVPMESRDAISINSGTPKLASANAPSLSLVVRVNSGTRTNANANLLKSASTNCKLAPELSGIQLIAHV